MNHRAAYRDGTTFRLWSLLRIAAAASDSDASCGWRFMTFVSNPPVA
jgi:hypothetical protein